VTKTVAIFLFAFAPEAQVSDLFISYRRGDSAYALLLYDRLSAGFGRERVFRDVEGIGKGEYFDKVIGAELKKCRAVVVVIGPVWRRELARMSSREDWVRREIALALSRKRRLYPVLVGGVKMPKREVLPKDMADLARANAVTANDASFHRDVDALMTALARLVPRTEALEGERPVDVRHERAVQFLSDQLARLQVRAVELIEEGKIDRAQEELTAGHELLMLLMDWSPPDVNLNLQLGYLYKTLAQAFDAAGDRRQANRYIDLAASIFEEVRKRPGSGNIGADVLASAINGLGNVYAARGQLDRALEMSRQAIELVPSYAYAWHDMFAALDGKARKGQIDVAAMRRALDNTRKYGSGQPGLSANHLADLEHLVQHWAGALSGVDSAEGARARRRAGPRQQQLHR
jgi:tetratricopeptide (TPR) repeat protein